jgi:hypothetical protein
MQFLIPALCANASVTVKGTLRRVWANKPGRATDQACPTIPLGSSTVNRQIGLRGNAQEPTAKSAFPGRYLPILAGLYFPWKWGSADENNFKKFNWLLGRCLPRQTETSGRPGMAFAVYSNGR